jgi:hypothetical protein
MAVQTIEGIVTGEVARATPREEAGKSLLEISIRHSETIELGEALRLCRRTVR